MLQQFVQGGLETIFNHLIKKTEKVEPYLHRLNGKVLGIKLQHSTLQCYVFFSLQHVDILQHYEGECDCHIEVASRLLFQFPKKAELSRYIKEQSIILTGDLQVLQDFVAMVEFLEKDPAELLSPYVGDVIAQSAVSFGQKFGQWVQQKTATSQRYWGERLTEEWQLISPSLAIADFAEQVDELAKDTVLLEMKIAKLVEKSL
ncbi:ubiquinone biosynthesis accessory factor UbiJ [Conservatibacter flavescens]|uniref:Ubiquinone biosynthesis accessory factor UbiJ n=1 Tax=Conservatibacter flavescens TaxID=28161 RepID=A0A2M8S1T9_9PAST|nr:SCP2 sterol-binding domain-containing protein [Conservatibacter flavescens]PJG85120.1 SCP2 domain-containing protein [Conservatibacter flavescens]